MSLLLAFPPTSPSPFDGMAASGSNQSIPSGQTRAAVAATSDSTPAKPQNAARRPPTPEPAASPEDRAGGLEGRVGDIKKSPYLRHIRNLKPLYKLYTGGGTTEAVGTGPISPYLLHIRNLKPLYKLYTGGGTAKYGEISAPPPLKGGGVRTAWRDAKDPMRNPLFHEVFWDVIFKCWTSPDSNAPRERREGEHIGFLGPLGFRVLRV